MRAVATGVTIVIGLLPAVAGCSGDTGNADDAGASEHADRVFIECATEHGVRVDHVAIGRGEFDVVFADDVPSEVADEVVADCEPRAEAAFEGEDAAQPVLPEVPSGVATVRDYLDDLEATDFSGAVLVAADGEAATVEAYGFADRSDSIANAPGTAFDIGSIAKSMTAVAVLRLVDAGLLSLDDTLHDLLPGVPADKADITVEQLLDFTSGLPEYHDTDGDFEPMSRAQALDAILEPDLRFEPGTDEAYSNSSYTLAAIVVEEVTGRPFVEVVEEMLDAVGLRATGFYGSARLEGLPVAHGYEGERHLDNDPTSWEATWALFGAGGMVATVGDLYQWWETLTGGDLLGAETDALVRDSITPAQSMDGLELQGLGGTNDFGFDAVIVGLPAHDAVIVVATNANPPERTIAQETGLVLTQLVAD